MSAAPTRKEIIEMGIDEDGIVEDQVVETYYCPREEIGAVPDGRYLRVIGDNGGTNVEIRIPYEDLENNGWAQAAWQPIETAPKTGDGLIAIPFLAFCPNESHGENNSDDRIRVIWWEPFIDGGRWSDDRDLKRTHPVPTHWMPLPEAPRQPS